MAFWNRSNSDSGNFVKRTQSFNFQNYRDVVPKDFFFDEPVFRAVILKNTIRQYQNLLQKKKTGSISKKEEKHLSDLHKWLVHMEILEGNLDQNNIEELANEAYEIQAQKEILANRATEEVQDLPQTPLNSLKQYQQQRDDLLSLSNQVINVTVKNLGLTEKQQAVLVKSLSTENNQSLLSYNLKKTTNTQDAIRATLKQVISQNKEVSDEFLGTGQNRVSINSDVCESKLFSAYTEALKDSQLEQIIQVASPLSKYNSTDRAKIATRAVVSRKSVQETEKNIESKKAQDPKALMEQIFDTSINNRITELVTTKSKEESLPEIKEIVINKIGDKIDIDTRVETFYQALVGEADPVGLFHAVDKDTEVMDHPTQSETLVEVSELVTRVTGKEDFSTAESMYGASLDFRSNLETKSSDNNEPDYEVISETVNSSISKDEKVSVIHKELQKVTPTATREQAEKILELQSPQTTKETLEKSHSDFSESITINKISTNDAFTAALQKSPITEVKKTAAAVASTEFSLGNFGEGSIEQSERIREILSQSDLSPEIKQEKLTNVLASLLIENGDNPKVVDETVSTKATQLLENYDILVSQLSEQDFLTQNQASSLSKMYSGKLSKLSKTLAINNAAIPDFQNNNSLSQQQIFAVLNASSFGIELSNDSIDLIFAHFSNESAGFAADIEKIIGSDIYTVMLPLKVLDSQKMRTLDITYEYFHSNSPEAVAAILADGALFQFDEGEQIFFYLAPQTENSPDYVQYLTIIQGQENPLYIGHQDLINWVSYVQNGGNLPSSEIIRSATTGPTFTSMPGAGSNNKQSAADNFSNQGNFGNSLGNMAKNARDAGGNIANNINIPGGKGALKNLGERLLRRQLINNIASMLTQAITSLTTSALSTIGGFISGPVWVFIGILFAVFFFILIIQMAISGDFSEPGALGNSEEYLAVTKLVNEVSEFDLGEENCNNLDLGVDILGSNELNVGSNEEFNSNSTKCFHYTVLIEKKPDAPSQMILTNVTDTMYLVSKDGSRQEVVLNGMPGVSVGWSVDNNYPGPPRRENGEDGFNANGVVRLNENNPGLYFSYTIKFDSSNNFPDTIEDAAIVNDFTFTFINDDEESENKGESIKDIVRAVVKIGDAPDIQSSDDVCWPTTGRLTQGPYDSIVNSHTNSDAVDIANPEGTEIFSPFAGTLEIWSAEIPSTSENVILGNHAILYSDVGTLIFAHFESFAPGFQVENSYNISANTLIGYMGTTAGPGTVPSHLHYQLRKNSGPTNLEGLLPEPLEYSNEEDPITGHLRLTYAQYVNSNTCGVAVVGSGDPTEPSDVLDSVACFSFLNGTKDWTTSELSSYKSNLSKLMSDPTVKNAICATPTIKYEIVRQDPDEDSESEGCNYSSASLNLGTEWVSPSSNKLYVCDKAFAESQELGVYSLWHQVGHAVQKIHTSHVSNTYSITGESFLPTYPGPINNVNEDFAESFGACYYHKQNTANFMYAPQTVSWRGQELGYNVYNDNCEAVFTTLEGI